MESNSNINAGKGGNEELPGVLKQAGRRIPYSVPEGYFESLSERVMDAVDDLPVNTMHRSVFSLYSRRLRTIAASIAVLLFAGIAYALVTEVILPAFNDDQPVPAEVTDSVRGKINDDATSENPGNISGSAGTETPASSPLRPSDIFPSTGKVEPGFISPSGSRSSENRSSRSNAHTTLSPFTSGGNNLPVITSGVSGQNLSKGSGQTGKSSELFFADTIVCKGTILTFSAGEDPRVHSFQWFVNGSQITGNNSGSLLFNTSRFNYGTQRVSLIVSEKNIGNVVKVYNAAVVVAESPVITSERDICGYDRVNISTGITNPNWEYQWSTGDRSPGMVVTRSGKYWVTVRLKGGGCSVTDTFNVRVLKKPSVDLGSDRTVCTNDKVSFEVENTSDQYIIRWSPGGITGDRYNFQKKEPGVYKVRVEVEACKITSHEVVIKVNDCNLIIPNVFTPNGDGRNDYLLIRGLENYSGSKIAVTDRNGRVVYDNNDYRNDWDGGNLPDGTYFYVFYPGGNMECARKGTVSIRR